MEFRRLLADFKSVMNQGYVLRAAPLQRVKVKFTVKFPVAGAPKRYSSGEFDRESDDGSHEWSYSHTLTVTRTSGAALTNHTRRRWMAAPADTVRPTFWGVPSGRGRGSISSPAQRSLDQRG